MNLFQARAFVPRVGEIDVRRSSSLQEAEEQINGGPATSWESVPSDSADLCCCPWPIAFEGIWSLMVSGSTFAALRFGSPAVAAPRPNKGGTNVWN